jgi:hypothetical protein
VSGSDVYGAFIEENSSVYAAQYVDRVGDALGFVSSTTDAASFGSVRSLQTGGPFARPEIAVHGTTVYIAYEKITNGSVTIGGGVAPITIYLTTSSNGGASFSAPVRVPGLNASDDYTSLSPSLAVNATGALAIAYATNRTCLAFGALGSCNAYGDSIVVVTSTNLGATWNGPFLVAKGAGETACYPGSCLPGYFESTPQTSIAFSPAGTDLYVVYSASYRQGAPGGLNEYSPTGIFAGVSSNGGSRWTSGTVAAPTDGVFLHSFDPGLSVSSSGVYVTYVQTNSSSGFYGFADSVSQWWASAPLAATLHWTPPTSINIESFAASGGSENSTSLSFAGDSSSIAFSSGNVPLVAFPVPQAPVTTTQHGSGYYYVNTTYATDLAVGSLDSAGGPGTVSIVYMQAQLPLGTPWTFSLNGLNYLVTAPAVEVNNIPADFPVVAGAEFNPTFWEIVTSNFNATAREFYYSQTIILQFQVWVGLEFFTFPGGIPAWMDTGDGFFVVDPYVISLSFPAFVYADWEEYSEEIFIPPNTFTFISESIISYGSDVTDYSDVCSAYLCPYTTPWYFPLGSTLLLNLTELAYGMPPPSYWTGQGNGSYSGPVQAPPCQNEFDECDLTSGVITMNGPINETLWVGDSPEDLNANITISSSGLPASSHFDVTLNSTAYTAAADSKVTVHNLLPGAYMLTNISGSSATPGWEYFGAPAGPNPFVSPVETGINLQFDADVHVAAALGTVSFHAPGIPVGTTWSISFNQTTYTSSTPWINLTTHPGTYLWSAGDAVSPGGSSGFVPTTPGGNLSVVPGGTYTVDYATAYQVVVLASPGGLVSAQGQSPSNSMTVWEAGGSTVHLAATTTTGYSFAGWTGTGPGAYSGTDLSPSLVVSGPIVESASFVPLPGARFNLTLVAEGLPANTWWSVNVGGVGYASNTSSLTIGNLWPWSAGTTGQYALNVPVVYQNSTNLTRFVPLAHPSVIGTNGTLTGPVILDFAAQVFVQTSASAGGSVEATYQGAPVGSSDWVPLGANVTVAPLSDPGYLFSGWVGTGDGSYSGTTPVVSFTASGPVSEVAVFAPVTTSTSDRYSLTISLTTPLTADTEWSVTFGGQGYSSTTGSLTIPDLALGTYGVQLNVATSPDGLAQYHSTPTDPAAYTVKGNASIDVAYATSYWVAASASVGGSVSPGSGWYAAGTVLYLVATSNSTYSFAAWTGTGPGNYTGSTATASLIVSGPITEVATFTSNSGGASAASIWSSPDTWLGLGAVGLIAGLVVGVVLSQLRTRPASPARGTSPRVPPQENP